MTYYYNTATNEYPRHQGDLELLGWTTEDSLPFDWVEVTALTEQPLLSGNQMAYEILPENIDGVWTRKWAVRDMTLEEIERKTAQEVDLCKNTFQLFIKIKIEPDARLLALSGSLRFRRSLPGHQKLVLLYT